jgi:hypothetical protein
LLKWARNGLKSIIYDMSITTTNISGITYTTATTGGNVTATGGVTITFRGVCWSKSQNPTTSDSKTSDGSGTGTFTSSIIGLTSSTTHHVRAYVSSNKNIITHCR